MDLLRTILLYLTMVFVSSVQSAPDPSLVPQTPTPAPTTVYATASPTPVPTPSPTPVPTPNITPNTDYRTIKVGDKGNDVKLMQRRLAELGYYTGTVDGVFGNQTRRAVERFQYYQGLAVDGIAGKRTLTVLYESTEVVYAPVDVTPTPSPRPTLGPTAAITTPPATPTPAPTFVPTSTATVAGTIPPTGTTAATSAPPTVVPSTPVPATDTPVVTGTPAATDTPAVTDTPVLTDTPAATDTPAPADTATPEPSETPLVPQLILTQDFMLTGATAPLSLLGPDNQPVMEGDTPVLLRPMQLGTDLYVPIFEILRNTDIVLIPGTDPARQEIAFSLLSDMYQISYVLDNEGNVTDLQAFKNMEPQLMSLRNAVVMDGVFYLPMNVVTELTQITFTPDEAATRYTVALPSLPEA